MLCVSSRVQLGHHPLHSPMFVAGELGGTNVKMEGRRACDGREGRGGKGRGKERRGYFRVCLLDKLPVDSD